jgi:hypothetical protein
MSDPWSVTTSGAPVSAAIEPLGTTQCAWTTSICSFRTSERAARIADPATIGASA